MAEKRNAALGFIFITLLIDCTGFGVIIPVMPKLIQELTGSDLSLASKLGGWLMFSYAIMQFVCAPIVGALSDKYGRRPVLLASLLGLGIDYLLLTVAPTMAWLFAGRLIAGVFGASFTTAQAYIADISTPEKRAQNFGMVGAAFGIGFILGPAMGGIFSSLGTRVPFMVAALLSLVNFIYGYFVLPESLKKENRRAFDWKRANPIGSLAHVKRYPAIAGILMAMLLVYIASFSAQSTWAYYTMEKFNWDSNWVGYSLTAVGIMVALVQGWLMRLVIPKIGKKNAVFAGLALSMTGQLCFAFATKGWMMFPFLLPYCLGGIAMPSLQGIVSSKIPPNEQGELQGVIAGMVSITAIIGPLIMTNAFAYFTNSGQDIYFPGAPFFIGAILTFISILVVAKPLKSYHAENEQATQVPTQPGLENS